MSETTVRINLRIEGYFDPFRPQLRDHTIQISYSKIDHPCLAWVAEILGVARKWRENSASRLLNPLRRVVIARRAAYAEHIFIPRRQGLRVLRSAAQSTGSSHVGPRLDSFPALRPRLRR